MTQIIRRYRIGDDFTQEEFEKWINQLKWWISQTMTSVDNPEEHAKNVIKAALNGTKLDGTLWHTIPTDFYSRVKQLASFDLKLGIGTKSPNVKRGSGKPETTNDDLVLPPIDMRAAMELKEKYRNDLLAAYPHLSNAVYDPKVDELAETIVKSRMLSNDFLLARGRALETLGKVRESLHKQIGALMDFLEISPKIAAAKFKDTQSSDVGSLVARMEAYGKVWQEFERVDALRELIQKYHRLKSTRPDGTPQLDAWELWHETRSRPVRFKCRHGEEYELLGGFTPEEIEEALKQANKVYGFGLEPIDAKGATTVAEPILNTESFTEDMTTEYDNDPDSDD